MKRKDNAHRSESGQSFVELGISMVVMLLLLSGVVDLGRAFFAVIALREAAQEGAIYGAIMPSDISGIEQRIRSSSNAPVDMSDSSIVHVTISPSSSCAGGAITVTVTYDMQVTMPFMSAILGSTSYSLGATITDTILRPPCSGS